jgi:hypothetical protein
MLVVRASLSLGGLGDDEVFSADLGEGGAPASRAVPTVMATLTVDNGEVDCTSP